MEQSDKLLTFLGKPETDPDIQTFFADMKQYLKVSTYKHFRSFHFDELGFHLDADDHVGCLLSLTFHIFTRAVQDGDIKPYSETLPFGITVADSRVEVRSKLGVEPFRSTPLQGYPNKVPNPCERYPTWWDSYVVAPFRITFIFRSPIDGMDLMGIFHLPTVQNLEIARNLEKSRSEQRDEKPALAPSRHKSGRKRPPRR